MRRKDREITDYEEILSIIKNCSVCTLALFDEEYPYTVPLNFGVELVNNQFTLYFHGANEGKKIELSKKNSKVSFEMHCKTKLITGESACEYTMEYESVCGNGMLEMVEDKEKGKALQFLMKQYDTSKEFEFDENMVNAIGVLKLNVNEITGKHVLS